MQHPLDRTEAEKYADFVSDSSLKKWADVILSDMNETRCFQTKPITSSYSVTGTASVNLIQGRDYSAEENRYQYFLLAKQNRISHYQTEMQLRKSDMDKCIEFVKKNLTKGARFLQLATRNVKEKGSYPTKNFIEHSLELTGKSYNLSNTIVDKNSQFGSSFTPAFGVSGNFNSFKQSSLQSSFKNTPSGGGVFGKPNFGDITLSTANSNPATNTVVSGAFGRPSFGPVAPSEFSSTPSNAAETSAFGKPVFGLSSFRSAVNDGSSSFTAPSGFSSFTASSGFSSFTAPSGSSTFGQFNSGVTTSSPFAQLGACATTTKAPAFGQPNTSNLSEKQFGAVFSTGGSSSLSSPFGSQSNSTNSPFMFGNNSKNQQSTLTPTLTTNNASPFSFLSNSNKTPPFCNPSKSSQSPFAQKIETTTKSSFGTLIDSNQGNIQLSKSSNDLIFGMPTEEENISPDELPESVLQAFMAESFTLGFVPDIPPPRALIHQY